LRIAIISDIHANLPALQAVFSQIDREKIDKTICLGDVVGYGPNPNDCMDLVRERCEVILMGNHDYACIYKPEMFFFNHFARQAIEYTLTIIKEKHLEFINGLPFRHSEDDLLFVHANPLRPEGWEYILSIDEAIYYFPKFSEQICFIGHSHLPTIFIKREKSGFSLLEQREISLENNCRYIINVGSVGQPRDGNPAASFGIVDLKKRDFEIVRVAYDIEETIARMEEAGLPAFLAQRLRTGK